jgi:haloalkane dehalogenase
MMSYFEQVPTAGAQPVLVSSQRPQWLSEKVWPFETSTLEVDDSRIAITDVGKGPVLLFVHTGFWSFIWRDVMLRLAGEFRCVCFDAPGTGQGNRLPGADISLDRASRALTAVTQALDLTDITLVVHDLGGPRITASSFGVGRHMEEPSRKAFLFGIGTEGIRSFHSYLRDALKANTIYTQIYDVLTGPFRKLPVITIFGERNDPLGF